jgi:hypothetical protein
MNKFSQKGSVSYSWKYLMIMKFIYLTLAFLSVLSAPGRLFAQEVAASDSNPIPVLKESRDLVCRIISTFMPHEELYYDLGQDLMPLPLYGDEISEEIYIRNGRKLTIYHKVLDEDGVEVNQPILFKTFPAGDHFLGILGFDEGEYRLKFVNVSDGVLKPNEVVFINQCSMDIVAMVGDTRAAVNQGEAFSTVISDGDDEVGKALRIKVGAESQGEKRLLCSRRVRLRPDSNMVVVCFASHRLAKYRELPFKLVVY